MKKIFIALAMMAAAMMATSCKDTVNGFVYNVNVEGTAAGDIVVTFPNGDLGLDGTAALTFHYSNDTTLVQGNVEDSVLLGAAQESENEDVKTFATAVNNGFSVRFKNPELGGSYHVRITGYAKEPNTGIIIAIDKEFNYPEEVDE